MNITLIVSTVTGSVVLVLETSVATGYDMTQVQGSGVLKDAGSEKNINRTV